MCGCRCCVSSSDSCRNTFLVLRLYLKSSIPSGSPVRKGREVHFKHFYYVSAKASGRQPVEEVLAVKFV